MPPDGLPGSEDGLGVVVLEGIDCAALAVVLEAGLEFLTLTGTEHFPNRLLARVDQIQRAGRAHRAWRTRQDVATGTSSDPTGTDFSRPALAGCKIRWMGSTEAGKALHRSPKTIGRMVDRGELDGQVVGGRLLVNADQVDEMGSGA